MRITNGMMSRSFLRDVNRNLTNYNTLNKQLTSGKEISKPSDNPLKAARIMQLYSDISSNDQYTENIKDVGNWLDTTDTSLDQLTNSLQRVRELMVSSSNAAYGTDELGAIKDEINEKMNEVAQILNTNYDGKYIFGGTKTNSKPVGVRTDINGNNELFFAGTNGEHLSSDESTVNLESQWDMLSSSLKIEISRGVAIDYSITAKELMLPDENDEDGPNLMKLLNQVVFNLGSADKADRSKVAQENLSTLDKLMQNISSKRSEVGAKQNRIESALSQNEEDKFNMTEVLSKTEDIDFAEKMVEVTTMQTVYTASLQASAKVMQTSLLDFLK